MIREEDILHQECVKWLSNDNEVRHLRKLWFHTANGEKRSIYTKGKLAGMGVLPGVPDLFFIHHPPFCIELKAQKGYPSKEQKELHQLWATFGIETYIVKDIETLKKIVREKYKI